MLVLIMMFQTKKAVKNINLNIDGGSMTAFVGHSGAGKSTIINLFQDFTTRKMVKFLIDNQDIKEVSLNL